jgi:hypothetical protein
LASHKDNDNSDDSEDPDITGAAAFRLGDEV